MQCRADASEIRSYLRGEMSDQIDVVAPIERIIVHRQNLGPTMTDNWYTAVSVFHTSTGKNELDEWIAPRRKAAIARTLKQFANLPKAKLNWLTTSLKLASRCPANLIHLKAPKRSTALKRSAVF